MENALTEIEDDDIEVEGLDVLQEGAHFGRLIAFKSPRLGKRQKPIDHAKIANEATNSYFRRRMYNQDFRQILEYIRPQRKLFSRYLAEYTIYPDFDYIECMFDKLENEYHIMTFMVVRWFLSLSKEYKCGIVNRLISSSSIIRHYSRLANNEIIRTQFEVEFENEKERFFNDSDFSEFHQFFSECQIFGHFVGVSKFGRIDFRDIIDDTEDDTPIAKLAKQCIRDHYSSLDEFKRAFKTESEYQNFARIIRGMSQNTLSFNRLYSFVSKLGYDIEITLVKKPHR